MATIPTAYTWTVGELLTSVKLNAYLRDAVTFLLARPFATLVNPATQSITTATDTALTWSTEVADTDGGHSTVTNTSRYTVQTAGHWTFTANVPWASNATGRREVWFRTNGTFVFSTVNMSAGASLQHGQSITEKIFMLVGDYVEAVVHQTSGGNLNVDNAFRGGQRFHAIWERA